MRSLATRPLSTLEILDAAVLLVRQHWARLYAYSSAGTLPLVLLVFFYYRWLGTLVEETDPTVFHTGTVYWAAAMAAAWALNSVARASVAAALLPGPAGKGPGAGLSAAAALRHVPGAVFVGLISFTAGWLGASLLLFPGLLLAAGWWTALPAVLVERKRFTGALRRSWQLTEGYRARSFGLWLLIVLLWIVGGVNLYFLIGFLIGTAAGFFGIDTSGIQPYFNWTNRTYFLVLGGILFMLIDPLKTALDAVLYLDLRVRREGADLQERLRTLRSSAALSILLLILGPAAPAGAVTLEEYVGRIRELRKQVNAAGTPRQVDRAAVSDLRSEVVTMPDGQKVAVENRWVDRALDEWKGAEGKAALLRRIDALDRSLRGVGGTAPRAEAEVDPKLTLGRILREPEFQKLAERPELRDLVRNASLQNTQSWWEGFVNWIRRVLFKTPELKLKDPNLQGPRLDWLEPVFYVLLAAAVLFVLGLLVRSIMERPLRGEAAAAGPGEAPLEASSTENALDHSADQWEVFAREWLHRGEVRQAVRALYLATLVHLHRERRIDYNRAFTNWIYVRQFRGEPDSRETLRRLTRTFDEIWYGDRPCGEEQYRAFERGARELGTPAPNVGAAHA